ncbi:uncharacterized protein LOC123013277 isoform X2 [Tribolium madens]|uniref:uncharacterized protein LOC123013277 isoform X2 n=1 Tax=Tribolium madens TaxID=41895 RepID=UPI001CF743FB|nr:uncharacterized protein LOC123013277 isoform X2 [Tribolium madens]
MSSDNVQQIIGVGYLSTIQGVCKIAETIFSFIGVLLVGVDYSGWVVTTFEVAASFSIIIAVILLLLYVTGVVEKVGFQWNKFQFGVHIILAIYYIVAVALVLHHGRGISKVIAGGIFGLFAVIAHLLDAFDNYRKQPLF